MNPDWIADPVRYAIALASVRDLGLDGTAEFRKDTSGSKGGMSGIVHVFGTVSANFFGKAGGIFTIEGSQAKKHHGEKR